MAKEINFLRERHRLVSTQEKKDRRLLRFAFIVFGGIFFVFLVSLGVHIYLDIQLTNTHSQQTTTRSQIVQNQDTERMYVVFAHKLAALSRLFQDRADKKEAIAYFTQVFSPAVFIKQIDYDPTGKLLVFRVQSDDVFHLKEIFTIANAPETQQKFISVATSDLQRMDDGKYEMSIVVSMSKDAPKTSASSAP